MIVWCAMDKILCVVWKPRELNTSFMVTWMMNHWLYNQALQKYVQVWQYDNFLSESYTDCCNFALNFIIYLLIFAPVKYVYLWNSASQLCTFLLCFYHQEKQHYSVYLYPDLINTYLLVVFLPSYLVRWHI